MNDRVAKIYLDTSVFGGFYDSDFEEESQILSEQINMGQFQVIFSNTTEEELLRAPEGVQELLQNLPERLKTRDELTEEAVNLADKYLKENVVGRTSKSDCFHIAMATIYEVDILVSWSR